jgi:hypothetical protein
MWRLGELQFEASPNKKSISTNKKLGIMSHIYHPNYAWSINRRTVVPVRLGRKVRPYLKNNKSKKGWELGSSCRALAWQVQDSKFNPSSPPNPPKKHLLCN